MDLKEEKYLELILIGGKENTGSRDGMGYYVAVYSEPVTPDTTMLFYESTFMSGTLLATKYGSRSSTSEALKELEKFTFSKARARIALELYDVGEKYEQNIYTHCCPIKSRINSTG